MPQTFRKEERLCSLKQIDNLIKKGESFYADPFRVVFIRSEDIGPDKILVSVSKRNFKRAVERNLLKRRIREAYRKNRPANSGNNPQMHIMFVYTKKEILSYNQIEQQIIHILHKLR